MYRFVILLLVFYVNKNSGFSVKKVKISPKDTSDSEVYAVVRNDGEIKFTNPKHDKPILREIEYLRVVEKPYNVEEESTRPPTNGHGYPFYPLEESKQRTTDPPELEDINRIFTNGHGYQFFPPKESKEYPEDYSDEAESPDIKEKNATEARNDLYDASKKKYNSSYSKYFGGLSGKRHKREMTKNIPPAPSLPPMTYDEAQELVRRILNNDKMPKHPTPPEGPSRLDAMNNGADLVINNTLSFFPPPNLPNLRKDYVPKTYGMSLRGNEGFTWNNIADPRRPQDINFNILNQNEQTKTTSAPKHTAEIMKQLHLKLDNVNDQGSEKSKYAERPKKEGLKKRQQSDGANKITKDVNPDFKQNFNREVELPKAAEPNNKQPTEKEIEYKSEVPDLTPPIHTNNNEFIDVRSQMQEMFAKLIPPPPRLEDSERYTPGTHGMRLNNGEGVTWNNLGKPMASKPIVFTTPKPRMDNQTKNIQPQDPEMSPDVSKVFQQIYEDENAINDEAPENYNEIDETIPSVVFNDDYDEARVINPRSYGEPANEKNGYSLNDIPPPKLAKLNFKDGPVLNTFNPEPYPKQNTVQNDNANVDKDLQEKIEKSFEGIMNKIPFEPFLQEDTPVNSPDQNKFNPEPSSIQDKVQNDEQNNNNKPVDEKLQEKMEKSFNDMTNKIGFGANTAEKSVSDNKKPVLDDRSNLNMNNLGRGVEGTYGMDLRGDHGYVWNKLAPNYYDYNIGEQQTGGEVEGFTNEEEKQTESPAENSTENPPIDGHKMTEGPTEATYLTETTPSNGNEVTTNTTEVPCATTAQTDKEISTTTVATTTISVEDNTTKIPEGNKDCNTTVTGVDSNALNTTTESTVIDTTKPLDDKDNGGIESTSDISSTQPNNNITTMSFTEATTVENNDENSTNYFMTTTESIATTTQSSDNDDVNPTNNVATTEASVTEDTTKPNGSSPPPSANATRPLNLNDLLQSAEFWQWLSDWTVPYMEVMNETVRELVKEEVAKQFAEREANNSNIEENKPTTEKPIENQTNTDKNNSIDKTSMIVEAQSIYGNSLNDKQVTNIFVFYPNNKTFGIEDINIFLNNGLNATNKPNNTSLITGDGDETTENNAEGNTENGLNPTIGDTTSEDSTITTTESSEFSSQESLNDTETSTVSSDLESITSTVKDKGTTTTEGFEATTEIITTETTEVSNDLIATESVTADLDDSISISTTTLNDDNSTPTEAIVEEVTEISTTEMSNENELITNEDLDTSVSTTPLNDDKNNTPTETILEKVTESSVTETFNEELITTESSVTEFIENITETNVVSATEDSATNNDIEIATEINIGTATTEPDLDKTTSFPMENGDNIETSTDQPKPTVYETITDNINEGLSNDSFTTSSGLENVATESMVIETTTNMNEENSSVEIVNDITTEDPKGSVIEDSTDATVTLFPTESNTGHNKEEPVSEDIINPTTESNSDATNLEEDINGQLTTELPNITTQIISTEEANASPLEIVTEITNDVSSTETPIDTITAENVEDLISESTTELSLDSTITEINNEIGLTTIANNDEFPTESEILSTNLGSTTELSLDSTTNNFLNDAILTESTTIVSDMTTNSEIDNDVTASPITEKSEDIIDNTEAPETPVESITKADTYLTTISDTNIKPFESTTISESLGQDTTEMTTEQLSESSTENNSKNEIDSSTTENPKINDNDGENVTISSSAVTEENKLEDFDTATTEQAFPLTTDDVTTIATDDSADIDERLTTTETINEMTTEQLSKNSTENGSKNETDTTTTENPIISDNDGENVTIAGVEENTFDDSSTGTTELSLPLTTDNDVTTKVTDISLNKDESLTTTEATNEITTERLSENSTENSSINEIEPSETENPIHNDNDGDNVTASSIAETEENKVENLDIHRDEY